MSAKKYYDDYIARFAHILADDTEDRFKAQFEIFDDIRAKVDRIPLIEERLNHIETKMDVIELVIKGHDREIKDLQAIAHAH